MKQLLILILLLAYSETHADGLDSLLKHRYHAVEVGAQLYDDLTLISGNGYYVHYINKGYKKFSLNPGIGYMYFARYLGEANYSSHIYLHGIEYLLDLQYRTHKYAHFDLIYSFASCKGREDSWQMSMNGSNFSSDVYKKRANISTFAFGEGISIWKMEASIVFGILVYKEGSPYRGRDGYLTLQAKLAYVFNKSKGMLPE